MGVCRAGLRGALPYGRGGALNGRPPSRVTYARRLQDLARTAVGASVGRDALTTIAGGVAGQLALLVSGILVARLLGVEDRGHLALFAAIALAVAYVASTGLPASITYWVARDPGGGRALARLIVRVGLAQSVVGLGIQAAALTVAVGTDDETVRLAALISLPMVPLMIVVMEGMAFLQGLELFKQWAGIRLLPAVMHTVFVGALAIAGLASLVTVTVAWVVAYAATAMATVWRARATLPPEPETQPEPSFTELQRFGAKAFLGSASPSDTLQIDQLVVGFFLSTGQLGLYVVGLALTNLPRFIAQSIGFVVFPYVARRGSPRAARRAMWLCTGATAVIVVAVVVVLELAAGWLIPLFFGAAFAGAIDLARALLVAAGIVGIRRVLADAARGAGYPGLGTAAEVASLAVLVPAAAIAAGLGGALGVAVALVIAAMSGLAVLLLGLAVSALRRRAQPAEPA